MMQISNTKNLSENQYPYTSERDNIQQEKALPEETAASVSISNAGNAAYRKQINDGTNVNDKYEEFVPISIDPAGEYYLDMENTLSDLMKNYKKKS